MLDYESIGKNSMQHSHSFDNEEPVEGERRTRWVVIITLVMMAVEITAGVAFGSMALLVDGWHMGTHAMALGIALFAYAYARRHATNPQYTFGTGKVGPLAGFASSIALGVAGLIVLWESALRLGQPVRIDFNEAIFVAVLGLAVNLGSAVLLSTGGTHGHGHDHGHGGHGHGEHRDHNLRGAYLHVLADALTSVLAIAALIAGRQLGWNWMDPAMGIVGSLVITKWSIGLLRDTSRVLLDAEVPLERQQAIRTKLEEQGDCRVHDLHIWRVGREHLGLIATVETAEREGPEAYKALLAPFKDLKHLTIEEHVI